MKTLTAEHSEPLDPAGEGHRRCTPPTCEAVRARVVAARYEAATSTVCMVSTVPSVPGGG